MDKIKNTISFLQEALLEEPENVELRMKLGYAYLDTHEYEKAEKQFALVLRQEPENERAQQGRSIAQNKGAIAPDDEEEKLSNNTNNNEKTEQPMALAREDTPPTSMVDQWFEKAQVTFKDVGGMDELKEEIRLGIVYPFQNPEVFQKYGKKVGGGMLLYGPPGCGKTHIARATAGEIQAMFLNIGIDDILDMWIGQSEKKVHALFETAREHNPTVLFIDEVDALGANRSDMRKSGSTLVNQLLTEMDGMDSDNTGLMTIGATNTPWAIDPAFRRPGRFDKVIFVSPPDEVARAEIFKLYLQEKPTSSIDYLDLAKRTTHYSGADISRVCDTAAEQIVREIISGGKEREISMDDLLKAIHYVQPTTREWFSTAKNYAKYADESGVYAKLLEYIRRHKLD